MIFKQIIKFGIVGVIATVIDYVVLYMLTECFNIYYFKLINNCLLDKIPPIWGQFQSAKVQIYTQNAKKMGFYFVIYPQSLTFATV